MMWCMKNFDYIYEDLLYNTQISTDASKIKIFDNRMKKGNNFASYIQTTIEITRDIVQRSHE